MEMAMINTKNKWTSLSRTVHSNGQTDGQASWTQLFDFVRKEVCPLMTNLGVKSEGTLPGKGQ